MIQSILIPKIVYQVLSNNKSLQKYIGNKIFPVVAELGTEFPYVAFSKTYINPTYTKDFYTEDTVGVEIVVASIDYLESLDISNTVRSLFECKTFKSDSMEIKQITFTGITEGYDDEANAFVQRLTFEFKVR